MAGFTSAGESGAALAAQKEMCVMRFKHHADLALGAWHVLLGLTLVEGFKTAHLR